MSKVFVIQNQEGQFLSRQKEWADAREISTLFKTPHRDLAVNELFEVTSKNTAVRAKVVETDTSDKGLPLVAELPPLSFPSIELPDDMAAAATQNGDNSMNQEASDNTEESEHELGQEV